MNHHKNIVILISGRGSNMQALVEAKIPNTHIAAVISNRAEAQGLQWAQSANIPTAVLSHRDYPSREAYDAALQALIDGYQPDLVVLAGFMRVLSAAFCQHYQGRLINIHPSLLPAFTGLNTHHRAIEAGCRIAGCTVHFVTPELDCGPIIVQGAVPILDSDTAETLAQRVLTLEHRLLPQAVADWIAGHLEIQGNRVHNRHIHAESPPLIG